MPYINIDIDINDVIGDWGRTELVDLAESLLKDGYVPDGWAEVPLPDEISLEDPAVRLAVITELRRLGYTVEPA